MYPDYRAVVYSGWKLLYVCSSSPSVYYLDWAYFCGARRYRSRIARRDVAHACDPVTRQVGKSTMVLSRPIRGSLRTTGRFDPRPMCEYEGFLTPSASVRVLIESSKPPPRTDGRQGGVSPFVSLFPTAGLKESIIGHADALLFPNSDELIPSDVGISRRS